MPEYLLKYSGILFYKKYSNDSLELNYLLLNRSKINISDII